MKRDRLGNGQRLGPLFSPGSPLQPHCTQTAELLTIGFPTSGVSGSMKWGPKTMLHYASNTPFPNAWFQLRVVVCRASIIRSCLSETLKNPVHQPALRWAGVVIVSGETGTWRGVPPLSSPSLICAGKRFAAGTTEDWACMIARKVWDHQRGPILPMHQQSGQHRCIFANDTRQNVFRHLPTPAKNFHDTCRHPQGIFLDICEHLLARVVCAELLCACPCMMRVCLHSRVGLCVYTTDLPDICRRLPENALTPADTC